MKGKYLVLFLGQQGGIGYPPLIVKIGNRWFAISDSRISKTTDEFYEFFEKDTVKHGNMRVPRHSQAFVWTRWHRAPKISMEEALGKQRGIIKKIRRGK